MLHILQIAINRKYYMKFVSNFHVLKGSNIAVMDVLNVKCVYILCLLH